MTIKLFEGQTNHPLSPEELKEFRSRSTVFVKGVDKEEQHKIFNRILNDANKSPTARSIIRQALQANESFHYDFRETMAKRDEKGNLTISDIPIKEIIMEGVHEYAKEP